MRLAALGLALLAAMASTAGAAAQGVAFQGGATGPGLMRYEFWADLEPVAGVGEEWPVSAETARSRILSEAAWVYGGMIWGFEFAYTPYDKARSLAESFVLSPLGGLPPEALAFASGSPKGAISELRSFVEYRPAAGLVDLMAGYAGDPWKGSQGTGKADMALGVKGRRAAYEDALRQAVRSFLQGLDPNKPRLARGRVAFERPPTMAIIEGSYTARVRARVMATEVLPYKVY